MQQFEDSVAPTDIFLGEISNLRIRLARITGIFPWNNAFKLNLVHYMTLQVNVLGNQPAILPFKSRDLVKASQRITRVNRDFQKPCEARRISDSGMLNYRRTRNRSSYMQHHDQASARRQRTKREIIVCMRAEVQFKLLTRTRFCAGNFSWFATNMS